MIARFAAAVSLVLLAVRAAAGAPVAIVNAGFEAPYLGGNLPPQYAGDVPATAFPTGAAPAGWQTIGAAGGNAYVGVLNPGVMAVEPLATGFPAGAPEGDNVVLLFYDGHLGGAEFGVRQTLATALAADTVYTLSVAVGNIASGTSAVQPYASAGFFDLRGFPGYRVELLAGGVVIAADDNSLLPAEGTFLTSTARGVVDSSHPQLGQMLEIRLVNMNQPDVLDPAVDLEVDFDAIALDASPLAAADFDRDGSVDGVDLAIWREAFQFDQAGDADDDMHSDGDDFLIWQRQLGSHPAVAAARAVPEPAGVLLAGLAVGGLAFRRQSGVRRRPAI